MSIPGLIITVPLFDKSERASTAFNYEDCWLAGAVVSTDGDAFFLLNYADLDDSPRPLGEVPAHKLDILTMEELTGAGVGSFKPEPDPTRELSVGLPDGIAIAITSVVGMPKGNRMAILHVDPTEMNFNWLVPRKWVCDPHGEMYFRTKGGPCPKHLDGTLK